MTRGDALALLNRIDRILALEYTRETRADWRHAIMDARIVLVARAVEIRLEVQ